MYLVILLYMLLASTFTLGKAALEYINPILLIALRMGLASAILLIYCFATKSVKAIKKQDVWLFIQIVLFHIYFAFVLEFWSLEYISSIKVSLFYNLSPFITALFMFMLHGIKLTKKQVIGLLIGFFGFLPVLYSQDYSEMTSKHVGFLSVPEIALLISITSACYGWIIMRELITKRNYSALFINGVGMAGGSILAFITSFIFEGVPRLKVPHQLIDTCSIKDNPLIMVGIYIFLLVLVSNVIFYNLYGWLLKRYSPTFLSFAGFTTPLFASLYGWVFLGEMITLPFIVSMIIVSFGIYLFYQDELNLREVA